MSFVYRRAIHDFFFVGGVGVEIAGRKSDTRTLPLVRCSGVSRYICLSLFNTRKLASCLPLACERREEKPACAPRTIHKGRENTPGTRVHILEPLPHTRIYRYVYTYMYTAQKYGRLGAKKRFMNNTSGEIDATFFFFFEMYEYSTAVSGFSYSSLFFYYVGQDKFWEFGVKHLW